METVPIMLFVLYIIADTSITAELKKKKKKYVNRPESLILQSQRYSRKKKSQSLQMHTFHVVFEWKKIICLPPAESISDVLCLFHGFTVCIWKVVKRLKAVT